jgi:hypothetical protein
MMSFIIKSFIIKDLTKRSFINKDLTKIHPFCVGVSKWCQIGGFEWVINELGSLNTNYPFKLI